VSSSGESARRQREPHEWFGATVRTLCEVDPCDCLHPLHYTRWTARSGSAGLAQQCPTAAEGPCLVPVGEEAIMPQAHKAARQDMQQDAVDNFVRGKPHGLGPIVLTTVTVGKTHPAVLHVEAPGGRDGHTMGIAADLV
jgi:hypothetical protein